MNKIGAVPITFKEELLKAQKLSTAIYKLTHELKNPLSVCNGYLEMMEYCDDRKRDKYLSIINSFPSLSNLLYKYPSGIKRSPSI